MQHRHATGLKLNHVNMVAKSHAVGFASLGSVFAGALMCMPRPQARKHESHGVKRHLCMYLAKCARQRALRSQPPGCGTHHFLPHRRRGAAQRAQPCGVNAELHGWPQRLLMLDVGMQLDMQQALASGLLETFVRIAEEGKPGFLDGLPR